MVEVQIDTIVGPTHYYGGLAYGNVASMQSKASKSNPKLAALQGLEKMKLVYELGIPQIIFPPQPRPVISALKLLGFSGSDQQVVEAAFTHAPDLLLQCSSQSAMWTANAATISPSSDTKDGKVHITPANLSSHFHRSLETAYTQEALKLVFSDPAHFIHHVPLNSAQDFADEGAANHTRFGRKNLGLHLFVYGMKKTSLYPARQTLQAQEAIARLHLLDPKRVIFAEQNPKVIDQGVFHNDVIAVGHEELFFFHEEAYVDTKNIISRLTKIMPLTLIAVSNKELAVKDAVKSYLFNSQLLTRPDGRKVIICPTEVEECPRARAIVEKRLPIDEIYYLPLNQSMKNGGGPACLRLRLPLTEKELKTALPTARFTLPLYEKLKKTIQTYYPEAYTPKALLDPIFRKSAHQAVIKLQKTILQGLYTPRE